MHNICYSMYRITRSAFNLDFNFIEIKNPLNSIAITQIRHTALSVLLIEGTAFVCCNRDNNCCITTGISNVVLHNHNRAFSVLLTTNIFSQLTEKDFFLLYYWRH